MLTLLIIFAVHGKKKQRLEIELTPREKMNKSNNDDDDDDVVRGTNKKKRQT